MIATLRNALNGTLVAVVAAGCASNVRLDPPTIPEPLIERIPMTVALRLPDNFESFVHTENVMGREEWEIDLGRSNAVFFTRLFQYMFDNVIVLNDADDPSLQTIDALIEPSIDAFEFSIPSQTKTDAFAVWIRYRVRVYDRDGELVANVPISAYGKSLTTTMGGSEALQRAAVLAMRDAAALMIIKLDKSALVSSLASAGNTTAVQYEGPGETTAKATVREGNSDE